MTAVRADRSGRMLAWVTAFALIGTMALVAPAESARADDSEGYVDPISGLTLRITAAPDAPISEGDAVVFTYTAVNETDMAIEVPEEAAIVTGLSGRMGELLGGCEAAGFRNQDEWTVGDAVQALPTSIAAGEAFSCTRSFVVDADDVLAGGVWATVRYSATGDPASTSNDFTASLLTAIDGDSVPTISGAAAVGETLTATTGFFGMWNDDLTYRWLRDGAEIDAATESTYVLTPGDVGTRISVRVTGTATNADGSHLTRQSTATDTVGAGTMIPGAPTVSGSARVGQTLTAVLGTWNPAPDSVTYQWLRGGVPIPGATGSAYSVAAADLGKALSVRATGTKLGFESVTVTSVGTAAVAAGTLVSALPTISGTAAVGFSLTVKPGAWSAGTTFAYRWLRNGVAITGATAATYKPVAADAGAQISVTVTGSSAGYVSVSKSSAKTAKVLSTGAVTRTGTVAVGSVQTAVVGTWTTGTAFSYQWRREGVAIAGATRATYTLGSADAGKRITVTVTGTKSGYATAAKTSANSPMVATAPTPSISGTAAVGSTLTAKPGTWSAGSAFTYQWLRNGAKISGATASTYKLASADAGKQISVIVTGAKSGFATIARTSAKSAKVATVATPKIVGSPKVGVALTVNRGTWTAGTAFTYQWLRNGVAISGATGASYKPVAADVGKKITVTVTGRLTGFATVARTSAATGVVAAGTLVAPTPKITGTLKVSSVLTASAGTWTSGTTVKYQWLRNGTAISGATARTYTLRPTDAYAAVSVRVTGTKAGYTTVTRSSSSPTIGGKVYSTCALLNKDYPDGIRKSGVTVDMKRGVAKPLVGNPYPSTALYNLQSIARDADRDGIMCER